MSGHEMVCFDKTFEAAEALLHMESPGGLHNERSTGKQTRQLLLYSLLPDQDGYISFRGTRYLLW